MSKVLQVFLIKIFNKKNILLYLDTEKLLYLRQGMSEEETKSALSERQRTFTLEKCIERHGEEEDRRIFEERQIKWLKKMDDLYQAGAYSKFPKNLSLNGTSQVERMFIDKIIRQFNLPENYVFCYRTNQLLLYDKENCRWYFYDFAYKNKIIEVNGDYWHMNPERFGPDDENYMTGRTASETWSYDARKKETACTAGYEVLHIWERDIRRGESDVFENIKLFLER